MPPKSRRIPNHYDDDSHSTFSVDTISRTSLYRIPPSEHTSLLPQPLSPISAPWHCTCLPELLLLLKMTLPIALAYSLQMSLETTSILIVGRLSPSSLSTATFAYMFAASTAWLIGLGGTTALDTLCPRTFTSRTIDPTELGILLQRAFIILTGFYVVFIIPLWWWSEPLFLLLGQEKELSHQAKVFLRWLIPGGFGYVYFEAAKKFLLAQGIVHAPTAVLLVTAPLNALLNWVCVYGLKMGLVGAPVATGVCYWMSFGLVVGYARWVEGWRCWGGWNWRCLEYLEGVRFARLAFLGFLHVGTEWWAFELTLLLAGRLGPIPLATHSLLLTLDHLLSTLPFSLSLTLTTRLGHLLGHPSHSSYSTPTRTFRTALLLSLLLTLPLSLFLLFLRTTLPHFFTSDPAVIMLTSEVMPWFSLFQIADAVAACCGGALRARGWQAVGVAVNASWFYGAAVWAGLLGVKEAWGGLMVGMFGVAVIEGAVLWWWGWGGWDGG